MPFYPTAERGVKKDWRLVILTKSYNRNLQGPEPARWECVDKQFFEIPNRTEIGAKRVATHHLSNDICLPEASKWHRESLWWSRWNPLAEVPNSYKITSIFEKYCMRAELIEVTE